MPITHHTRQESLPYCTGLASGGRVGLRRSYMLTGGAPGVAEWGKGAPKPLQLNAREHGPRAKLRAGGAAVEAASRVSPRQLEP